MCAARRTGKLGQRPHRIFGYLLHTTMMPCGPCITTNTTPPTKPPHAQYNRQSRHILIASTLQSSDLHAAPVTGCSGSGDAAAGALPGDCAKHAEIEHMFDYLVSWYVTRDMWRVVCDGPSGLMRPRAGEGGAGHGDGCGAN